MTSKSKIFGLSAGVILALGTTFAIAQTRTAQTAKTETVVKTAEQTLSQADQELLLSLLRPSFTQSKDQKLAELADRYSPAYVAPTLEIFNFIPDSETRNALLSHLRETTGQNFGTNMNDWYRWLWNEPEVKTAGYDNFKAEFYSCLLYTSPSPRD